MNKAMHHCLSLVLISNISYSMTNKLLGLMTLVPLVFVALTPINAASAVVLSIGGYPPWGKAILGLVIVAFAGWGVNAVNHYVDRERDQVIWPERALPSGRVQPGMALASAAISLICALLMAWIFFNVTCFIILFLAIILGVLYSTYLRDKIGYLALPPIVGLISLGGWAAFSPETLFSTWLPWFLYILHLSWQAAHIMIYYPLHIPKGDNIKQSIKVPPTFLITPSVKNVVGIGIGFACITLLLSVLLPLLTQLGYFYIFLILVAGIYSLVASMQYWRNIVDTRKGLRAFTALSMFRLITVVAILLDILFLNLGWHI
jgi:4-hydroxybenzoate polyprenyltransferase